jgi:hypothetical protein
MLNVYKCQLSRRTRSRNLMVPKTLPTLYGTYMTLVTKPLSFRPSVYLSFHPSHDMFSHICRSNYWWQKSDIWSQASCRYHITWEAFLEPSDSYFVFVDLVGIYTHLTYMHIFRRIFLTNYWWHESNIWSQASYWYAILWEAFLDPSDSYFLFAALVSLYTHWTDRGKTVYPLRWSGGIKTLPTILRTNMKIVTKYQISAINSCWEKHDEKCAYILMCIQTN